MFWSYSSVVDFDSIWPSPIPPPTLSVHLYFQVPVELVHSIIYSSINHKLKFWLGKSTLLNRLFKDYPEKFGFSVSRTFFPLVIIQLSRPSDTTRSPRAGEINGIAYHFVSSEEFNHLISKNAFIEHAKYSSNQYGTTIAAVEDVAKLGKRCILDIDSQVCHKETYTSTSWNL